VPKLLPDVNSDDNDEDPMLSADGCTLYFARAPRSGGDLSHDLYSVTAGT